MPNLMSNHIPKLLLIPFIPQEGSPRHPEGIRARQDVISISILTHKKTVRLSG